MKEARRKLLTEALGEEWVEPYAANRTFATADDYEALREKVIEENLDEFCSWLNKFIPSYFPSLFHWWLAMSPEQCNELICDFGIEVWGWAEAIIEQEGK